MADKNLVLFDSNNSQRQDVIRKTDIFIRDEETHELLFRGHNKVIVSGSAFTAAKHFNITPPIQIPSYNTVLGLDHTVNDPYTGDGVRNEEIVYLFAVGVGGCGELPSQVAEVDYSKWIAPEDLVPFRYVNDTNDLPAHFREKYFGRKAANGKVAYYFKSFEAPPVFKQQYVDGTPIDENVFTSSRTDEVESFVELNLKVTKEDCRDFFFSTIGINEAKLNTISLLTAYKVTIDGYTYYQNIRPLTKLNFPNESLIDLTKGLDIIYHIYY